MKEIPIWKSAQNPQAGLGPSATILKNSSGRLRNREAPAWTPGGPSPQDAFAWGLGRGRGRGRGLAEAPALGRGPSWASWQAPASPAATHQRVFTPPRSPKRDRRGSTRASPPRSCLLGETAGRGGTPSYLIGHMATSKPITGKEGAD